MSHVLTAADVEALRTWRIFTTPAGTDRLQAGMGVLFRPETVIEKYVGIFGGDVLCSIGAFTFMWSRVYPLDLDLKIGRYCSIAGNVTVFPGNHPMQFASTSSFTGDGETAVFRAALADFGASDFVPRFAENTVLPPPVIGNDVWIGQDATLARGITLGHGCVVGTGSIVTKSVPPYAIVAGNPARVIRMRFPEQVVEALLASEWWRYAFPDFGAMRFDQPDRFVGELGERVAAGTLKPYVSSIALGELLKGGGANVRSGKRTLTGRVKAYVRRRLT